MSIQEKIGIGRRKTAVASVRLRSGAGNIDVNGKKLEEFFPLELQRKVILAPFQIDGAGNLRDHDMIIRVKGGGVEAQAESIRLGIARALSEENENLHSEFRALGYLTRDPRKKERKKYGLAGARKRFQFSKR